MSHVKEQPVQHYDPAAKMLRFEVVSIVSKNPSVFCDDGYSIGGVPNQRRQAAMAKLAERVEIEGKSFPRYYVREKLKAFEIDGRVIEPLDFPVAKASDSPKAK